MKDHAHVEMEMAAPGAAIETFYPWADRLTRTNNAKRRERMVKEWGQLLARAKQESHGRSTSGTST
jgi:hypothetical protein